MNLRNYNSMFQNEPDVLTVQDVTRLLKIGKNSVYALLKEGKIASIKQGKKIIVPKVCLMEYLIDERNYQILSPPAPINRWTYGKQCGSVDVAREKFKDKTLKKGA